MCEIYINQMRFASFLILPNHFSEHLNLAARVSLETVF